MRGGGSRDAEMQDMELQVRPPELGRCSLGATPGPGSARSHAGKAGPVGPGDVRQTGSGILGRAGGAGTSWSGRSMPAFDT